MSREMSLIGCKHALRGLLGVTNLHTFVLTRCTSKRLCEAQQLGLVGLLMAN